MSSISNGAEKIESVILVRDSKRDGSPELLLHSAEHCGKTVLENMLEADFPKSTVFSQESVIPW
jgi:hypothetical protein